MARKNGLKNDSSSITFNTRTKAVMADVVHDNIKEKVSAVREVVTDKSNNEIVLVLQYYDYDVEKTIQAYIEDGAKAALTEWHYSGTKPVKKKRNKKKSQVSQHLDVPKSPESISSESGSAASFMVNGDATKEPILNGVLDLETDIPKSSPPLTNGHVSPTLHPEASSKYNTPFADTKINTNSNDNSSTNSVIKTEPEVKAAVNKQVESTSGAKEKSPSPQPQRQPHGNRQRQHSGSHGRGQVDNKQRTSSNSSVGHGQVDNKQRTSSNSSAGDGLSGNKHGSLGHGHGHLDNRQRTSSTSSVGEGLSGKKHGHILERSAKDLHRQTVSLERLSLMFDEEVDKSYKRVKSVFDDIRNCWNAREAEIIREMNIVRDTGRETFAMRQRLAADLKVQIDRERMSETELAELRNNIKHFVSDRKVDEDMSRTTRFLYDDDQFKREVSKFGEVVPVKCAYVQQSHLVSSVSSNTAISDTEYHPRPSQKPHIDPSHKPDNNKKDSSKAHLDSDEAHEMAELQKRLKHSLTLEGIPVVTYPDRATSAPVTTSTETKPTGRPESANARSNNRNRRRPGDRDRRDRPQQEGPKDDSRSSYNQGSGGERVILIGRGTRSQGGGGSRPPRGGRGQGGYRGRGRGGDFNPTPRENPVNPGNQDTNSGNQGDSRPSTGGGRGSSPNKGQSFRGGSGSPRRNNRGNRGSSSSRVRGYQGNSPGHAVNSLGGGQVSVNTAEQ